VFYLEHTPASPLDRCIGKLWYAQAPSLQHARERVLPTGRAQVILNLARDYLLDCPDAAPGRPMPPSLIMGARSVYEVIDTSDLADLIGISFNPGGFTTFAGDAAHLFSNRSVALEDVWGAPARVLRDRLREIASPQGKLHFLEAFLIQRFAAHAGRHLLVEGALGWFQRAPAGATVREAAKSAGLSERRFSQIFREEVGLSPKAWTRVQRFQKAVQQLHAGTGLPWADLALECGYYDQSHFANEFRAFSGMDATSYSAQQTFWANHVPTK
jgi:AraC-like DNA-binding protein